MLFWRALEEVAEVGEDRVEATQARINRFLFAEAGALHLLISKINVFRPARSFLLHTGAVGGASLEP